MRKLLMLTSMILFFSSSASADDKTYEINLLLQHSTSKRFASAIEVFKKILDEETQGKLKLNVISRTDVVTNFGKGVPTINIPSYVISGKFQMGQAFTRGMTDYSQKLAVFSLPGLFEDYEHLERVYDSEVGDEIYEDLELYGIKPLAYAYSGGFNYLISNKEVKTLKDLEGLNISVYEKLDFEFLRRLGAQPLMRHRYAVPNTFDFNNFYKAHDVSGKLTTYITTEKFQLYKNFKYINLINHNVRVSLLFVNKDFYDSLPMPYQRILEKATKAAALEERKASIAYNAKMLKKYRKLYNVTTMTLSAKDMEKVKEISDEMTSIYSSLVDKNIVKKIKELKKVRSQKITKTGHH